MVSGSFTSDPRQYDRVSILLTRNINRPQRTLRTSRLGYAIVVLVSSAVAIPLGIILAKDEPVSAWVCACFLAAGFLTGIVVMVVPGFMRLVAVLDNLVGVRGEVTVNVAEAGIEYLRAGATTTIPWRLFTGCSVNEEFVFVEQGPAAAVFVPRDAFSSAADLEAFVASARAHIDAVPDRSPA